MVTISWFVVHEIKSSHRQVIIHNSWFTAVQGCRLMADTSLQLKYIRKHKNNGKLNFKQIPGFGITLKAYLKWLLSYLSF